MTESVKEGETYSPQIDERLNDLEAIPSKPCLNGNEEYIIFDLEATGLSRTSDITQLSAFDGVNLFNVFVSPRQAISSKASEITGLSYSFERNQMYRHGAPVESMDIRQALVEFLEYINKYSKPVLVGHNIFCYDIPVLGNLLREFHFLSNYTQSVYGCIH